MRLITRKIWRAFPELDRFSDEQCTRFMMGAKRDWWVWRLLRLLAAITAFFVSALLLWAVLWVSIALMTGGRPSGRGLDLLSNWGAAIMLLGVVVPFAVAMLVAFSVRDALLRRRLRAVINNRGTCAGCGYLLLGMPVNADLKVTCPECGGETEVDASIAELQQVAVAKPGTDGDVRTEFRPSARVTRPSTSPEQRRRRRRLVLTVVAAIALIVLTPLVILGWNELAMRIDAKQAATLRPGGPGLTKVIGALPAPSNDVIGWEEFQKVRVLIAEADRAVWQTGSGSVGEQPAHPDYSWVGEVIGEDFRGDRAAAEESRRIAERMLEEMRRRSVFDLMKQMRTAGDLSPQFSVAPGQPLINILLPELAQCREMARINKARALTALAADDPAEFADAIENVHFLARLCEREPTVISRLVSVAIDALGDGVCKRALMTRRAVAWSDAVAQGQRRRLPEIPYSYTLEGERTITVDSACMFYENTSNVRRRQLELTQERMEKGTKIRVGRLDEVIAEINRGYDAAVANAVLPPFQRTAGQDAEKSELWVVHTLMPSILKAQRSFDQVEADRQGVAVMVALERFRAVRGAYPERLDELLPGFLASIPLDAWAGQPMCYRRIDGATDPAGRGYLLYVRGMDKTDDGGKPGEFYLDAITRPSLYGIDYIINDATYLK